MIRTPKVPNMPPSFQVPSSFKGGQIPEINLIRRMEIARGGYVYCRTYIIVAVLATRTSGVMSLRNQDGRARSR